MEKNNNKPKLRFPGFTDPWEQRKLNEIVDVLDGDRGNNYPNGNEFQERGHTLFLSASNVTTNGFVFDDTQYITEEKSNSMGNGKLLLDDIVLTSRGSIGHIAWYNKAIQQQVPFARINSGMLILRSKDFIMPCFIAQFLKSPLSKKQIELISFGSAQPQLTKKDVSNYVVSIPSDINEQMKLGAFFNNLDNIITLNQRKLNHLQDKKKSLLQKMFPKNGEDFPELRFPGFTDPWEQRKLGDVSSKIGSGKTPLGGEKAYKDYGVCLIRSQNVNYGIVNFCDTVYIDDETDEEMKNSRVLNGDVLLNITGASIGRSAVYHSFERANVNQHVCIIRPVSDEMSPEFIHLNLTSNNGQKQIDSNQAGGAREGLNFQQISKMTFLFPKIEEQEQIGVFFTKLDNLITLHQRKLNHLKEQKKALLQQMFV